MIVKHTRVLREPDMTVQNVKINNVHQYEYLGMLLDDKLTMNDYVDSMWKITNNKICILARIRRFISVKRLTSIKP